MNNPPAGWYPDPSNTEAQRYWDGTQWLNIPAPSTVPMTPTPKRRLSNRNKLLLWGAIGVVLLAAAGGATAKIISDQQAAAAEAEEQQRLADEEQAALEAEQDRLEQQEAADEIKRSLRESSIPGIEDSIRAMAEKHIADGILTGPVISVSCSPVGGGSTDDLDQNTTVFGCFVANVDNGDGTMSGYNYHATMNWDTGQYTYGLGAP